MPHAHRQRRKEARPQELLDAALQLFVEKGYAATRTDEVAQRAGVSKGTLYLYYPSKEELFKAVVRSNLTPILAEGSDLLNNFPGSTIELIQTLMARWWQEVGSTTAAGIFKLMIAEARNFPELAEFYTQEVVLPGRRLITLVISRGISRGEFRPVDPEYAAHAMIAPLQYVVVDRYAGGVCGFGDRMDAIEAFLAAQSDLMFHGLVQPTAVPANAGPADTGKRRKRRDA